MLLGAPSNIQSVTLCTQSYLISWRAVCMPASACQASSHDLNWYLTMCKLCNRQAQMAEIAEENGNLKAEVHDQAATIRRIQGQLDRLRSLVGVAFACRMLVVCPSCALVTCSIQRFAPSSFQPQSHITLQERQAASQRAMPVVPSMYGPVGAPRGGYPPAEHSFYHGEPALCLLQEQSSGPSPMRLNCFVLVCTASLFLPWDNLWWTSRDMFAADCMQDFPCQVVPQNSTATTLSVCSQLTSGNCVSDALL